MALKRAKILLVEDDVTVSEVVTRYLRRDGFDVDAVGDGETALERVKESRPDLMLIDVMLPRLSGFDVCRRLRPARLPIIMLTARGEESDRIMGLELGADDYVVKPFSPRELVARVRSVLRRTHGWTAGSQQGDLTPISLGDIDLDPRSRRVSVRSEESSLTAREYELLLFLMQHPATVFRRDELLEHVWGYTFGGTPTVTVHVQRLRKKIEEDPEHPAHIKTVWGVGYRFDP